MKIHYRTGNYVWCGERSWRRAQQQNYIQIHITMFRWQKAVSAKGVVLILIASLVQKATHCHTHIGFSEQGFSNWTTIWGNKRQSCSSNYRNICFTLWSDSCLAFDLFSIIAIPFWGYHNSAILQISPFGIKNLLNQSINLGSIIYYIGIKKGERKNNSCNKKKTLLEMLYYTVHLVQTWITKIHTICAGDKKVKT